MDRNACSWEAPRRQFTSIWRVIKLSMRGVVRVPGSVWAAPPWTPHRVGGPGHQFLVLEAGEEVAGDGFHPAHLGAQSRWPHCCLRDQMMLGGGTGLVPDLLGFSSRSVASWLRELRSYPLWVSVSTSANSSGSHVHC